MSNSTENSEAELQLSLFGHAEAVGAANAENWKLRVSARARNLKVQVYPHGGVEIVAPKRAKPAHIQSFIEEHRDWIVKTQAQFADSRPPEPPLPETIELGALAETFRVHYALAEKSSIRERSGLLTLNAPLLDSQHCWPLLQKWLKRKGRAHLVPLTEQIGSDIGLQPRRVAIRLQKTRWGSCSSSGTISLNAAVLLRPPEEMRYVILHELCHLRHMNHSQRYWRLVESFEPGYRQIERIMDDAWQTSPRWLIG